MLAVPLNQRAWTEADETAYEIARKRLALRTRKRELQQFVEELKGQRPELEGELVPLLSRVLDNVQLTISGLHIRYEDSINLCPQHRECTCALGLRLGAVRIKSADAHGRARFVERAPGQPMRKLIEIEEISVYLDVLRPKAEESPQTPADPADAVPTAAATAATAAQSALDARFGALGSTAEIQSAFRDHVASSVLLRPLSGRAVCEFNPAASRPPTASAVVIKVALQLVALQLTHPQTLALGELLYYAQHHKLLHRRQRYAALRPDCSPLQSPRSWWRYLGKAAHTEWAPKPAPLSGRLLRGRRVYMDGYREVLIADAGGKPPGAQLQLRLQELEQTLLSTDQVKV